LSLSIELGIPRLAFSGSGFFNLGVANSIDYCQPHGNVASETESSVPDNEVFSSLFDELKKAERKSFGVYMNSFYELELACADHFRKVTGIKAWFGSRISVQ
jgi:hypothetical protein